jgi:hypothetical protein
VWPAAELPRTEGTRKLKRREVRRWAETGVAPPRATTADQPLDGVLARFVGDRQLRPETTIEELGLSSLERVELMVALEERAQTRIDEGRFAGREASATFRRSWRRDRRQLKAGARRRPSGPCRRGTGAGWSPRSGERPSSACCFR